MPRDPSTGTSRWSRRNAALAARMALWRVALVPLKQLVSLPALARLMWSSPADEDADPADVAALAAKVCRGARGTWGRCLERSLLTYRYVSRAGGNPKLVVGVHRLDETVGGHVWVVVDGAPIFEREEDLRNFTPLTAFGPRGRREPPGAAVSAARRDARATQ